MEEGKINDQNYSFDWNHYKINSGSFLIEKPTIKPCTAAPLPAMDWKRIALLFNIMAL